MTNDHGEPDDSPAPRMTAHRAIRRVSIACSIAMVTLAAVLVLLRLVGGQLEAVATGSMEPAVPTGSVALSLPVDADEVVVGDVITFRADDRLVMHRVTEVIAGARTTYFRTQGDANPVADPRLVAAADVERRMQWSVAGGAALVQRLRQPMWLALFALLPIGLHLAGRALEPGEREHRPAKESDPSAQPEGALA